MDRDRHDGFPCRTLRRLGRLAGALAGLCALAACGDAVTREGDPTPPARIAVAARVDLAGSTGLVVEVTAADLPLPLVFNVPIRDGMARGSLEIPAGGGRRITVTLVDGSGTPSHRGSVVVDVVSGSNPPVALTLAPLAASDPVVVSLAAVSVQVTPHRLAMTVGDTARLSAVVIDARGDTLRPRVLWYSFDPRRVVVDSTGLLTARDSGAVQVLAGTSGVADAAEVAVQARAPRPDRGR